MRRRGSGRKPFRTITVPETIYKELQNFFKDYETELRKLGITSISGLTSKFILEGLERLKKQVETAKGIS